MQGLIICPKCESKGVKNVLGKLFEDGSFRITRYHEYDTEILSPEFLVRCGRCKTIVFIKKYERKMSGGNYWYWERRVGLIGKDSKVGIP